MYFCTCLTILCLLIIILHYILKFLDTSIKDWVKIDSNWETHIWHCMSKAAKCCEKQNHLLISKNTLFVDWLWPQTQLNTAQTPSTIKSRIIVNNCLCLKTDSMCSSMQMNDMKDNHFYKRVSLPLSSPNRATSASPPSSPEPSVPSRLCQ